MKKFNFISFESSICFIIICIGIYLSMTGGYGSDEDTLPMIGVFQGILKNGIVMSSRFTSYPVAELGIGFLAHNFGSWATNLFTFSFFVIGVIVFFISLDDKYERLPLFLLLCLSSSVLFFDNIEPIDYSWAFLFFALGIFFLKKNLFELAVLSLGFCIGTRINFTPFVLFAIFFLNFDLKISVKRKIIIFLCAFVIGGLFYLTIWFQNGFGLDWLTSARPTNQGITGIVSRFLYKTFLSVGPLFFIFLIFIYIFKYNKIKKFKNLNFLILIIGTNLLIFFYIPAELSYLQPMLISLYFIIYKIFDKKIIYIFIFLNFFSWILDFSFLDIKYKNLDKCNNIEAISATFHFKIERGKFKKYLESRDKIFECWTLDPERAKIIKKGGALKKFK